MTLFAATKPANLFFYSANEAIVTFSPDGRVQVNPKYTLDEAAQKFWEAVHRNRPPIKEPTA